MAWLWELRKCWGAEWAVGGWAPLAEKQGWLSISQVAGGGGLPASP